MRWSLPIISFVCLCFVGLPSQAQESCDIRAEARKAANDPDLAAALLFELVSSDCLGGKACKGILCESVACIERFDDKEDGSIACPKRFDDDEEINVSEKLALVADALQQLRARVANLDSNELAVAKLQTMYQRWESLDLEIVNGNTQVLEKPDEDDDTRKFGTATWDPSGLEIFGGRDTEVDLDAFVEERCNRGNASECQKSFELAAEIYSLTKLKARVLQSLLQGQRDKTRAYLDLLGSRWDYYFANARSLYPWELWINSAFYDRMAPDMGFANPPNNQLIVLHPTPAMLYSPDAEDTLEPGLLLEIAGWYHWEWGDKGGVKGLPIGGSVILAWDGADNEPGIGGLLHLPKNWSLGATYNSEKDLSLIVSVDLGKLIADPKGLQKEILSKLKGSPSD